MLSKPNQASEQNPNPEQSPTPGHALQAEGNKHHQLL